jgi:hypothetical protein
VKSVIELQDLSENPIAAASNTDPHIETNITRSVFQMVPAKH